jgi:adenylate cyclase
MSDLGDVSRKLVAVFAADVEGYSRLMGVDEVATLKGLTERRAILDRLIGEHRGRIANTAGDSVLAEFGSAVDPVQCAVEAQTALAEANSSLAPDRRISFRIGVHIGDVMVRAGDLFGDGVNIAARLQTLANPGTVCISGATYDQVRKVLPMAFVDLGVQQVKNIQEPIRTYQAVALGEAKEPVPAHLGETASPLQLPDKPSIAVLPFQNMSGDPEQEYFADGMVEDIITALSRFRSLFVIARNSSFTYKGKAIDIKQVGRELGVRYVLEGSVRKSGGQVRVTAQLIEASTGAHLWADRFDQSLEDIFTLQDNVTMSVVGAIAPRLIEARTEAVVRKSAERWEVYDYYLQAVRLQQQWTLQATLEAQRILRDIIKLDPQLALAYARFAWAVQALRVQYQQPILESDRIEALAFAEKALALSDNDEVVLTSVASVFGFLGDDFHRGKELADRALAINPNMSAAWNSRGVMCLVIGEPEIALDAFARAIRLNPLDQRAVPLGMFGISSACGFLGRHEESEAWANKMLALLPSDIRGLFALLGALISQGKEPEADATVLKIKRDYPNLRASQLRKTYRVIRPEFMALVERNIARMGLPE